MRERLRRSIRKSENNGIHFRTTSSLLFPLLAIFFALGCASSYPAPQTYSDPLANIGRTRPHPHFSKVTIGFVPSENARKAIIHLSEWYTTYKSLLTPGDVESTNPNWITNRINEILVSRFKDVITYNNIDDVDRQRVDLTMMFDLRLTLPERSGQQYVVKINGIFLDNNGSLMNTVTGEGRATIPWPFRIVFGQAASSALESFSRNLDGSTKLAKMLEQFSEHKNVMTSKPSRTKIGKVTSSLPQYEISQYWAVIIGISKYKHTGKNGLRNLIFADDDAKAFARVLRNLGWTESHIKLLINEEATNMNIRIALESWLTKAGQKDQVVLFWAGHGFADPEDPEKVYFACYDTDISIPATGYRMDKVRMALEERNCRNVVLLADTCHAGKLITRGEDDLPMARRIKRIRSEQKTPKGWIFMVAADTDRKAIEHSSWTNGAFTHSLVKGLSGMADGYESVAPKDGNVTMGELRAYLNSAMPDETQKVLGVAKRPVITTSSGDPDIWKLSLQAK